MKVLLKILWLLLWPKKQIEHQTVFRYKYQRYPFDNAQFFTVKATNREAANESAIIKFTEMVDRRHTVMTQFYPV